MAKTKIEKITNIGEQIQQLENQRKRLIQEQKEQDRKDRTKRLCKRMGLFESLLPDSIPLSEEDFRIFLEEIILSEAAGKLLSELTAQSAVTTAPQAAGLSAQGNTISNVPQAAKSTSQDSTTPTE